MEKESALIRALAEACNGKSVGWFTHNLHVATLDFQAATRQLKGGHKITRSVGRESITTPAGGILRFISASSNGVRGMTLDNAYVPATIGDDKLMDIMPCLSASKTGRLGYYD